MDAVLEVDDEARARRILDHLIDACGAIALRGFGIFRQVHRDRHRRVAQLQVAGLAFLVVGKGKRHVGQPVEGQLAVRARIVDRLVIARLAGGGGVRLAVAPGAQGVPAGQVGGPHVHRTQHQAGRQAKARPDRLDVAHAFQVGTDGTAAHRAVVIGQPVALAPRLDRGGGGIGGFDPRDHRVVVALDARHVDHARRTAQQHAAVEGQLRQRLPAALGDGTGAIADALGPLQEVRDHRMVLEALELHVGIQVRVGIVQVNHKADQHLVVLKMIDEAAAAGILAQGPAHRVHDATLVELVRGDLPDLLHAQAELLRIAMGRQVQPRVDLLGQAAAHAFGDEDVLAVQLHPRLVSVADAAVGFATELSGDDTLHAITVPDHLAGGHAGEDFDPQGLGLFGQPAADIAHADDVVAVVRHQRRHRPVRHADLPRLAQDIEVVVGHLGGDRGALVAPVGDQPVQPAGVQHGTRQDVGAHLRALFQDHDGQFGVDLLQPDRGRQARRPRAHDHDVVFHRFANDLGLVCHVLGPPPWQSGCQTDSDPGGRGQS